MGTRTRKQPLLTSGEKSYSPTSPDFVPSIYPEKKLANLTAVDNLACHEWKQCFVVHKQCYVKKLFTNLVLLYFGCQSL